MAAAKGPVAAIRTGAENGVVAAQQDVDRLEIFARTARAVAADGDDRAAVTKGELKSIGETVAEVGAGLRTAWEWCERGIGEGIKRTGSEDLYGSAPLVSERCRMVEQCLINGQGLFVTDILREPRFYLAGDRRLGEDAQGGAAHVATCSRSSTRTPKGGC